MYTPRPLLGVQPIPLDLLVRIWSCYLNLATEVYNSFPSKWHVPQATERTIGVRL